MICTTDLMRAPRVLDRQDHLNATGCSTRRCCHGLLACVWLTEARQRFSMTCLVPVFSMTCLHVLPCPCQFRLQEMRCAILVIVPIAGSFWRRGLGGGHGVQAPGTPSLRTRRHHQGVTQMDMHSAIFVGCTDVAVCAGVQCTCAVCAEGGGRCSHSVHVRSVLVCAGRCTRGVCAHLGWSVLVGARVVSVLVRAGRCVLLKRPPTSN